MITVDNTFEKIYEKEGVFVNISATGWRGSVKSNQEVLDERYMSSGQIYFLPKDIRNQFHRIETKSNAKIRKNSIGMNYIPIKLYAETLSALNIYKDEFVEIKREVEKNYDEYKQSFQRLSTINVFPSKEKLIGGLNFDIKVSTFPSRKNLELLPEEVQMEINESISSLSEEYLLESISGLLDPLISSLGEKLSGDEMSNKYLSSLKKQAELTKKKNILNNSIVEFACDQILNLDLNNFYETSEFLISKVYLGLKKNEKLLNRIAWEKVPLSTSDMEILGQ